MTRPDITSAEVIVIGGGIIGCSIAYHPTQLGVSDVIVLERKTDSGTTWHAAGFVAQLRAAKHDAPGSLLGGAVCRPCAPDGQETGYQTTGSMTLALHAERLEEPSAKLRWQTLGVQCDPSVRSMFINTGLALKPAMSGEHAARGRSK